MHSNRALRRPPGLDGGPDRATAANIQLQLEYRSHERWLLAVLHGRYRLSDEDCEEIVNDILLAWYRKLLTKEGVKSDRAFCQRVMRDRAADRLRRKALPIVEFSATESLSIDLELDVLVAEREELRDLRELAIEVLEPREYEIVQLVARGIRRAAVAERTGLSLRQVKRTLERARKKLESGRAAQEELGRCAMVAQAIADLRGGAVDPSDPRRMAAVAHLARCQRCRRSLAVAAHRRGSLRNDGHVDRAQTCQPTLSGDADARR